jgi:hypothetical protein
MRLQLIIVTVFLPLFAFTIPGKDDWRGRADDPSIVHRTMKRITDVIVYDVYSPPVASRTYAYIAVAGYEAARNGYNSYLSLSGQLNQLTGLPQPGSDRSYSFSIAAAHAMLKVAQTMVISEDSILVFDRQLQKEWRSMGVPEAVLINSLQYGEAVALHIIKWAGGDMYKQTRSYPKFDVDEEVSTWKPTAPAYMKAVEPHWNKIRPFLIDSAQQFKPEPAVQFSTDSSSQFFAFAKEVYLAGKNLSAEQVAIADFWDCNPFRMNVSGHVMFATKKISPGGHWININATACEIVKADIMRSLESYACLAVTMADAFIICWDEKYRSRVIRPETYINLYIEKDWIPILQTPPFPEYTSGHSVVSAAAAVILTKLFGEGFKYTDDTEQSFGLPARNFNSFRQAAEEAAISRLYGGIHYMPAIKFGFNAGEKLGNHITRKLRTKGS